MHLNEIYYKKLQEMENNLIDNSVYITLMLKEMTNKRLDDIADEIAKITNKKTWNDYNFRTGKLLGILKTIAMNPTQRNELFEVTGLTQDYLDIYYDVCGNLPYLDVKTRKINSGKPMNIQSTKDFLKLIGLKLNILIEDNDLSDITEEKWEKLVEDRITSIMKTTEYEQKYPDTVTYEE